MRRILLQSGLEPLSGSAASRRFAFFASSSATRFGFGPLQTAASGHLHAEHLDDVIAVLRLDQIAGLARLQRKRHRSNSATVCRAFPNPAAHRRSAPTGILRILFRQFREIRAALDLT